MQEALDSIMRSKETTVIVIAHRLSTIVSADRIAVVSGGKVVELGSHEELLGIPASLYSHLYAIQSLEEPAASTSQETLPKLYHAIQHLEQEDAMP